MNHQELISSLTELRLCGMRKDYPDLALIAERENKSYEQYLSMLVAKELDSRQEARVKRLIKEAKVPVHKNIQSFDFGRVQGITARDFSRLSTGDFIKKASNVVLFGTFGVGKTHLAIALIHALSEHRYRCLFTSTSSLIDLLIVSKNNLTIGQTWKKLDSYDLIICDELGYIPQSKEGADLFFQLIANRYERKSLLITTNLTYSEWDKVFLNEVTTAAAVDRIIHRCETYNIKADSWRKREAKNNSKNQE